MYSRPPLTDYPAPISAWVYGIPLQTKIRPLMDFPPSFSSPAHFFLSIFFIATVGKLLLMSLFRKKLLFVQVSLLV